MMTKDGISKEIPQLYSYTYTFVAKLKLHILHCNYISYAVVQYIQNSLLNPLLANYYQLQSTVNYDQSNVLFYVHLHDIWACKRHVLFLNS